MNYRFGLVSSSRKRTETVQVGHHIIAIYPTFEDEINEAFEFLKEGLRRNEAVMVLRGSGKDMLLKRLRENEEELGNTEELVKRRFDYRVYFRLVFS